MVRITCILFALAITASVAEAQRAPDMATLDRGDGISKIGLDLAYTALDTHYSGALRFELYGQYVTRSGLGLYGALPLAHSFGDAPEPLPQPDTVIGNLDLGLLYVVESSRSLSWVFRGGVALPTASGGRDGASTNLSSFLPRMTDFALHVPDATYIRLGVSPLIHLRRVFLRVDAGFDIGIDDNNVADELVRLNVGGGVDLGVVAVSLELVNTLSLDEFDAGDDLVHTLAFTVRFMGEQLQPFLSVGVPLDDGLRSGADFFVAGGIQVAP